MGRLVGYGVSQVPTNGMLGGMAYQDPVNVSVNILRVGTPGGNWQPGNGNNASLAVSGIFTGSYTPSGSLNSLYAKSTVLGIANDAGVTENNSAVIGFSCLNASGFNSQAYIGAVSSPESDGDYGRGAILVLGRRSGGSYAESMRISRTGNVGIGTTQPAAKLDVVDSGASGSVIRSRVTTNNGGYLAYEALNSSGTSVFSVTHNGRINLSENIVFASGQGLDFSATANSSGTMTSELLSDYEEGTWTPTLTGTSGGSYTAGGSNFGWYRRIGNLVTVGGTLQWTAQTTAYSGLLVVSGLPYASNTNRGGGSIGAGGGLTFLAGYSSWTAIVDIGSTSFYIIQVSSSNNTYSHYPTVGTSGIMYGFMVTYATS